MKKKEKFRRAAMNKTMEAQKAYRERAEFVGFLAKIFPTTLNKDPNNLNFPYVVNLHTPKGIFSWHISKEDKERHFPLIELKDYILSHPNKYPLLRRITIEDIKRAIDEKLKKHKEEGGDH